MIDIAKRVFGQSNETEVKRLVKIADLVLDRADEYKQLSDAQLREKTPALKARLAAGETLEDILPDAFAACREAAERSVGMRPYPVQVLGGICLHQGRIAEMKTGEGKTLVATLPAYLNALTGEGVHIVTVNDYLAKRDSEWMGKIYKFLGLSVGLIIHDMDNAQRRMAYACDITYGTNNEMGFDYLRDNMVIYGKDMVQRGHVYAIVDEVDSILIDEARTPLIISGQGEKSTDMYQRADQFVSRLRNEADYTVAEKEKAVTLTDAGITKAQNAFKVENIADIENNELYHHILQALKAHAMMKRDVDYVVQNGEVIIVDEFTGRLMVGRRYSDGLHQAIEAKERVKVERESKTLATITFQNYFRMYKKISGMTGTAKTEEEEFQGIYNLDVVQIPTNMPMIRTDLNDVVYKGRKGKFNAVVEEIVTRHKTGQPLLVGTVNVETSEMLSRLIDLRGIPHEVLNAKNHQKEAEIVAQAGHVGAVTIATNMAGRGTDILLGGNPDFLARRAMRQDGYDPQVIEDATGHSEDVDQIVMDARKTYRDLYQKFRTETDEEHERVMAVGGLHIIGTERHESRRIDNQLRGRAGRQGDPGSTQFFISLEDDVMRLFGSERITPMIERLGLTDDQALEAGMLTRQIESAQRRIESHNYDIRKSVLKFDDVMNKQRELIYGQRKDILTGQDVRENILSMVKSLVESTGERNFTGDGSMDWNLKDAADYLEALCLHTGTVASHAGDIETMDEADEFTALLLQDAEAFYQEREKLLTGIGVDMREFERVILLNAIDHHWMNHIDDMDNLRDGIGLRAYGQRDPVQEYRLESYDMFNDMVHFIREETVRRLYQSRVERVPERRQAVDMNKTAAGLAGTKGAAGPAVSADEKGSPGSAGGGAPTNKSIPGAAGRNQPCPCGSGKKYKHCCGAR
ncbi:MAG: preprotein translocase subunit SecA [Clostridia bacterium]|nr:preprotein translocase subunit SecA [Clostridia bacterium]